MYITPALKSELGKSRAIYNCDTNSYLSFAYVYDHIKKNWRNAHCYIDPSLSENVQRLNAFLNNGTAYLSADYDDFNAQHPHSLMIYIVREVCRRLQVEAWIAQKLVNSVSSMYIETHVDGVYKCELMTSTLPSGHVLTTLWNSILNLAYIYTFGAGI